ncbi:MAG TPA: hypothetical protein VG722_01240 [Tepidisphaeraceae bacterium]|nr:hypothetical protein [Tepidisphaeraceae bacterium]
MRNLIVKSVYAGLGVLGSGKKTVEDLGHELARRADLSEKDGRKIAQRLRSRADKAITEVHRVLEKEIKKTVNALHSAVNADVRKMSAQQKKGGHRRKATARKRSR